MLVTLLKPLKQFSVLYQKGESELWRDPELSIALKSLEKNQLNAAWAKGYNLVPFEQVMNFLEESIEAQKLEIAEKEKAQQSLLLP